MLPAVHVLFADARERRAYFQTITVEAIDRPVAAHQRRYLVAGPITPARAAWLTEAVRERLEREPRLTTAHPFATLSGASTTLDLDIRLLLAASAAASAPAPRLRPQAGWMGLPRLAEAC